MNIIRLGAILCLVGVALGAFGAHGLKSIIGKHGGEEWWKTATMYMLIHALAVVQMGLLLLHQPSVRWDISAWLFAGGIVIFSGSLFAMSLTGHKWLGAITPIGGILLLSGWAFVVWLTFRMTG